MFDDIRQIRREVRGSSPLRFPNEFELKLSDRIDRQASAIFLFAFLMLFGSATVVAMKDWRWQPEIVRKIVPPDSISLSLLQPDSEAQRELSSFAKQLSLNSSEPPLIQDAIPAKVAEPASVARTPGSRNISKLDQIEQSVSSDGVLGMMLASAQGNEKLYDDVYDQFSSDSRRWEEIARRFPNGIPRQVSANGRSMDKIGSPGGRAATVNHDDGIEPLTEGAVTTVGFEKRGKVDFKVAVPRVSAGKGVRDPEAITAAIKRQNTAIEYCYKRTARMHPGLSGRIEFEVSIAADGRVSQVRIFGDLDRESKTDPMYTESGSKMAI